jgi:hypothetical protein
MHRTRLLDMEARLARPRAVMYGSLALSFLIGVPWLGLWPLALLLVAVLAYRPLTRGIATSRRPEYRIAASVLNAQVLLGIGIVLTGARAARRSRCCCSRS